MKLTHSLLLLAACSICTNAVAQDAPISINLQQHGATVSPNLYGIFFEEINHAGDGGLYAELVQNRGFEEHVLPSSMHYENGRAVAVGSRNYEHGNNRKWSVPWNIEEKKYLGWNVKGNLCKTEREVKPMEKPLHENTPNAMVLTISDMQKGGKAQLVNTGYWGMGLKKGEKYDLRFYVKSSDYKGTLTARIKDSYSGKELGAISFEKKKIKDWTEFTGVILSDGTTLKGELEIEFNANGTVMVDYVSLFPRHTFKGRKNGQRKDLALMLQNLHPKFMRWPGGCIVEGATYENRVKWKETLGDPMTRRGEWDVWGYRATWGMGYHEFLQFCEDLNMDGMFVDNAGMSCSVRNGDFIEDVNQLDDVVQDFRDAIEYALGDPTKNKWAKMRADAGHPKPFPLKYVEIGNENVGPEYVKHFNYIFEKLKAEYPQITFINTLAHDNPLLEQIPGDYMVDPHWYRGPNFFFNNNNLFDEASRKHDIYVGEYACNAGVGGGNLLAAISEAAFIMGMERNSDVVKMTSYAPLFENVNKKDWPCNLIHFNSSETYGRASYYVQQMAAENRPTFNVSVSETSKGTPARQFCQAGYDEQSGELVIKVVNGTDKPYVREFDIKGATNIQQRGRTVTLSGDANDENTFDNPTKLSPVYGMFDKFGEHFQYEFAPMSFTILRIRVTGDGLNRVREWRMDRKDPDAHDPVMAKGEDGRYYCFTTGMNVGVISSDDMVEWRRENSALKETPAWAVDTVPGYRGHTWAPDISYHNGLWHLYYSCSTFGKNGSAIGHAVNKTLDPESPDFGWEDKGMVIASHRRIDNWNAIDPNLIVDKKGQPWMTFGSFWDGIQLVKLSKDDFQTPETKPVTIARRLGRKLSLKETNDEKNWTKEGNNVIEAGENAIEAPFIFYHDGYYYLFVSFDYCCRGEKSTYKTVYGRSKKVEGPYLDKNGTPMEFGGGTRLYGPDEDYFGVGHNSAYEWDGKCYFVSHAYVKEKNGGAKLFIRPLNFDKKGWIIEE